jgi:hypothetical protein
MLGLAVGTALAGAAAAEEARAPSAGASASWGHSLASDLMSPGFRKIDRAKAADHKEEDT